MPKDMNQKMNLSSNAQISSTEKFIKSSSTYKKIQTGTRPSKGKSKYAQKARGKKFVKPVVKPSGPVNTYTSKCCGVPATKPACVRVDKKKALEQGLGSWRCTGCRKACKVTVSKFKVPESVTMITTGTVDGEYLGRGTGTVPIV